MFSFGRIRPLPLLPHRMLRCMSLQVGEGQKCPFGWRLSSQALLPAVEVEGTSRGSRRYIVTSYPTFWKRYTMMAPADRNHYEVIPEHSPCHLYLDVEYARALNPEVWTPWRAGFRQP